MSRPALNRCGKCGTKENLVSSHNICKACKAKRDRTYYEKRLIQPLNTRKNSKLAAQPFYVPPEIGPCGHDFDSEVCPKRQTLAVKRAKAKKKIDNICCLDCTIKIQEAQQ